MHAVFIRAPWVEDVGPGVDVLATWPFRASGIGSSRSSRVRCMATSFHPEVSDDLRIHRYFLDLVHVSA